MSGREEWGEWDRREEIGEEGCCFVLALIGLFLLVLVVGGAVRYIFNTI